MSDIVPRGPTAFVRFSATWPFIRFFVPKIPIVPVPTPRFYHPPPDFYHDDLGGPPPEIRIDFLGRAAVTRPSTPDTESVHGIEARNDRCLLLELPYELRFKIWREVLGEHKIHLFFSGYLGNERGRLLGQICRHPGSGVCTPGGACQLPFSVYDRLRRPRAIVEQLFLLRTCKQIYQETIDLLYSSTTFIISEAGIIEHLPSLLLPQRINAIRSLRFDWHKALNSRSWSDDRGIFGGPLDVRRDGPEKGREEALRTRENRWSTTWLHISKMKKLQNLDLRLFIEGNYWHDLDTDGFKDIFDHLRGVTIPKVFTLAIVYRPKVKGELPRRYAWEELPCEVRTVPSTKELY